jgi:hypothetical protein
MSSPPSSSALEVRRAAHVGPLRAAPPPRGRGADLPRHAVARALARTARIALAPVALLAAAVAGAVFLVLLPICGIATLAQGFARAAWDAARGAPAPSGRGGMSQD